MVTGGYFNINIKIQNQRVEEISRDGNKKCLKPTNMFVYLCVCLFVWEDELLQKKGPPSGFGASFKFHPGKTPVTWFVTKSSGWCGLSSVIRKNSRIVRAHRVSMVLPSSCKGSLCNTIPHK